MGGLALKNAFTRRYEREEFDEINIELHRILTKTFDRVATPLFYKNKKSFGDADLVITAKADFDLRGYINTTFKPTEIFHNGNCYSFDYKELQIDLIVVDAKNFDAMEMYLSYNDLGNFIGRLAHGLGLKYGQEGLWYEHYFKGSNIGSITVSQDYPKIYEFLGLDYSRWEKGFDELEDIFEYIATSKYFNWKMFQFDQLNKINRDRNAKRKSYMSFLEWIDANVADEKHEYQFAEDKATYFVAIYEAFPEADLVTEYRRLEYLECRKLYVNSKFNGGEVMRRFGLQGKTLGDALTAFREHIIGEFESYNDYIIHTDKNAIYADFEEHLNKYHGSI